MADVATELLHFRSASIQVGWAFIPAKIVPHARENGKRLGRPVTAGLHATEVRKLYRAGISKSEIARRLNVGRTSVRHILAMSKM